MRKDRWRQVQELFDRAVGLPGNQRGAFLDEACGADVELKREVLALLANDPESTTSDRFANAIGDAQEALGIARETESWRGEKLGVYTIIDKIAEGGMGAVYLAERHDDAYEQKVAIKLISDADLSGELERRFVTERQILANLNHPNIAGLVDGGRSKNGTLYLVMEYVSGESIDEYCDRHRLTIDERVKLFIQVCDAVQYAHQNLIIHRDIKPSNVLVTRDGEPKLIDFGIAKPISVDGKDKTRPDRRAMTPKHASPEQLLGDPVTTASDVYGLGTLLYELLSGSFPFDMSSSSVADIRQMATQASPPLPSIATSRPVAASIDKAVRLSPDDIAEKRRLTNNSLAKRLRGDLDAIILKAISRRPEDRYATARQLREDLQRHLEDQPVLAREASLSYRASKAFARYRLPLLGTAAVLAIAIGAESFYNARLQVQRNVAEAEAAKANKVATLLAEILEAAGPGATRGGSVSAEQLLDHGVDRIRGDLAGEPELMAELLSVVGRTYRSLGLYQESHDLVLDVIDVYERLLPANDERVADAYYDLGYASWELGLLEESLAAHRKAHEIYQAQGYEGPNTKLAASLREIALLYENLNDYERAEQYYVAALDQQHVLYPQGSQELALTQTDYAGILFRTERYAEAEPLIVDALDMRRRLLGEDHPDVAQGLNNLGFFYMAWGDLVSADTYLRDALQARVRLYGEDGARTSSTRGNLSELLVGRGKAAEALTLADEAYQGSVAAVGPTHRNSFMSAAKHLEALVLAERTDEAIVLGARLLGSVEATLDPGDAITWRVKRAVAEALMAAGDNAAARPLLESAEQASIAGRGADHFRTRRISLRLADIAAADGSVQAAIEAYESFLATFAPTYHEYHPEMCRALVRLGELHTQSGNPDRARDYLQQAVALYSESQYAGSPHLALAQQRLDLLK